MFTGFFLHYYYYWNFVTLLFIFLFKNMPVVLCTATEVIFSIMAKVKMGKLSICKELIFLPFNVEFSLPLG